MYRNSHLQPTFGLFIVVFSYTKILCIWSCYLDYRRFLTAPGSLLDALEQHLASLEGKKVKESTAASRASTLSNAVSSFANTGMSLTKVDEREKQAALDEEQARLKALKDQRLKELSKKSQSSPATTAASPVSTSAGSINGTPAIDLFSTPNSSNSTSKLPSDLLDLQPTFQTSLHSSSTTPPVASTWGVPFSSVDAVDGVIPNLNPFLTKPVDAVPLPVVSSDTVLYTAGMPSHEIFGGFSSSLAGQSQTSSGLNVDFDTVFGNKSPPLANSVVDSNDFHLGGILKPTITSQNHSQNASVYQPNKLVSDDLDSSLANLVGNLGIGNGTTKNDIHWSHAGEKKLTGGSNWQPKSTPSTTWNPPVLNGMHFPQYTPPVMAYPATTPTGVMGYGMHPQMGSIPVMAQPTVMYTQPVMRSPNPFGPVPGAQMQFM
ncbi:phosphatidylinositol-binding clathrin assembly protein [Protopterus annectens]|uniref:phosphatidylinositol-binding clathrin assembly protein n=1 Tax=Protopterus annectens TaxID=7888 RepID=UPI001CF9C349|nr:phosphatidylinositol-binding clathrin assembly protein [Protopterus annectens]